VTAVRSNFTRNQGAESGGALHIDNGAVYLSNETRFQHNSAPTGSGNSIYLSPGSVLEYTLPAPPGHWLNIRRGITFELSPGAEDLDFPYRCQAGVVGGISADEQSGPGCSRICPAGNLCGEKTIRPSPCTLGAYCPLGTTAALPCSAGRFSDSDSLESEEGCNLCPPGTYCSSGASRPELCDAGRFGAEPGQTSRECSGACLPGYYCATGSTSNTSSACPAGRFNDKNGGAGLAACTLSPIGTSSSLAGSTRATQCAPGQYQPNEGQSACISCAVGAYQPEVGAARCVRCQIGRSTSSSGSSTCTACNPGFHQRFEGQTQCNACTVGFYQPELGAAECRECKTGRNSVSGAAQCTVCSEGFYRPRSDSPAESCERCDQTQMRGVSCGANTTTASLNLTKGYWRHSTNTLRVWPCKVSEGWTPCRGGIDAGHEGDGYCELGYHGPYCELCSGPEFSSYFDKLDARCHSCDNVTARIVLTMTVLLFISVFVVGGGYAIKQKPTRSRSLKALISMLRGARRIWGAAGMRFKVKAFVGFYQCIAAASSVFNVVPPHGLEEWTRWIHVIQLPAEINDLVVPAACLGSYERY